MTTAWALAVRGGGGGGARAKLGRATALGGAAAGAAALLASAATGRRGIASWRLRTWGYLAAGWLAVVLIDWARRLVDA